LPDTTPPADSELSAAITEYQKRWETPATGTKDGNPEAVKSEKSATEQAPAGDSPGEDKSAETPTPEPEATEDLSHIPEQYREAFKALPPEAQRWAKDGTLRQSDYTKKTQATATERKALEAEREKQKDLLTFATNVLGDPRAVEALKALAAGSDPVEAEKPFGWSDALLEGKDDLIDREITRRAETIAAKKAAEVEARINAEVKSKAGPNPLAVSLIEAHGEDYDNVVLDKAFKAMAADFSGAVEVTPENVAALIKPYLPKIGSKSEASKAGPSNGATKGATNGVSPLTRGGGVVAPLPPPHSYGESGKPKTRQQLIDETLYEIGRANGHPVTLQDIGARMRGDPSR